MNSIRVGSQRKGTLFRVAFSFEGFSQSTLNDRHFQMHRLGKCIQPQRILEYREHNAPQSLYTRAVKATSLKLTIYEIGENKFQNRTNLFRIYK